MNHSETQGIYWPNLAFAGTLPFIALSMLLITGSHHGLGMQGLLLALKSYGLLIVSFMAGSLWGLHLAHDSGIRRLLAITSNAAALLAWFGFLLVSDRAFLLLLAGLFVLLLLLDLPLWKQHLIDARYFRVRLLATTIVAACLIATASFASLI
ncbi:MAG: DUF3429 domain-containing protein [Pseudomonadota bacterium]|nr:DUF3429 domain-containing protein [Pseudomonadota bacterium]